MAKPSHLKDIIPLLLALLIIILLVICWKYWNNNDVEGNKVEGFENYINNHTRIDKNVKKCDYIVYCFWTGNNEMSENRKKCLNSIYQNIGVPVKLITPNNLNNYILPSEPLHPGYQYLSEVHKSDYLRTYFMHHYGGGYTDIKMTTNNWNSYFDELNNSDKYLCNGYQEIKGGTSTNLDYKYLIGNGSYIFKPNTDLTKEWYKNMIDTMDKKYLQLKENPSSHPRDHTNFDLGNNKKSKYPLKWAELLCDNFHPVIFKYNKLVLKTLPKINTNNYR